MKGARGVVRKKVAIVSIVVPIGLLHFVTGSGYRGPFPGFVNGYLLDILVPLAFYLLLCGDGLPVLRSWMAKSALVFGAAFSVEIVQFYGIPLLGRTFDPMDFAMYGAGVVLAALLDAAILPRLFVFWAPGNGEAA